MTDVTTDQVRDEVELSAADEQLVRELTERARTGGLKLTGEGGLLGKLTKMVVEGALEGERVMAWLNIACGARALINQSDVRIAFDVSSGARRVAAERSKGEAGDDVGLVVKGFARLRGEFGPLFFNLQVLTPKVRLV